MAKFKLTAGIAVIVTMTFAGTCVAARDQWMSDTELVTVFNDVTIDGVYTGGRPFIETYRADGRVEYEEGPMAMGGHWSVTAGTLCTIYTSDPTGGCFRVARVSPNCFEFYFAARTEQAAPGPDGAKPAWTARGSISGKGEACAEGADV